MVSWRPISAFIIGGAVFTLLQPLLSALGLIAILALLGLILVTFVLPGGWFVAYFVTRTALMGAFFKAGRLIIFSLLAASLLAVLGIILRASIWPLSFLLGGLLGLYAVGGRPAPRAGKLRSQHSRRGARLGRGEVLVKLGKRGVFGGDGLSREDVSAGVLVAGLGAPGVVRTIVKAFLEHGRRVIVIGRPSMVPGGVEVKYVELTRVNIAKDLVRRPLAAESFSYSFAIAHRLRNDDVPLLTRSAKSTASGLASGKVAEEDALRVIVEGAQEAGRAAVMAAAAESLQSVDVDGVSILQLAEGGWDVLLLHVKSPSQRDRSFLIAYTLLTLRGLEAAVVLENPELLVRDVNLIAYDSREPWEYIFNTLADWRAIGLVIVSKNPILSEWVYRLCQSHVFTRLGEHVSTRDAWLRDVIELARTLNRGEAVVSGSRGIFKVKLTPPEVFKPPSARPRDRPEPAAASVETEPVREREATLLEKEFGVDAVKAARLLKRAKSGLRDVAAEEEPLLERLKGLGFLTDFGGRPDNRGWRGGAKGV